jgi:hypothetical protein
LIGRTSNDYFESIYNVQTSTTFAGQYRYELTYTGTDAVQGYVDALEVLPETTDVSIGGGGSPQTQPYNIEVYTSADAGTNHLIAALLTI